MTGERKRCAVLMPHGAGRCPHVTKWRRTCPLHVPVTEIAPLVRWAEAQAKPPRWVAPALEFARRRRAEGREVEMVPEEPEAPKRAKTAPTPAGWRPCGRYVLHGSNSDDRPDPRSHP